MDNTTNNPLEFVKKWNEAQNQKHDGLCPNCGYCPHCGRGRQTLPYYPVNPWYPSYPVNPWYQPPIIWTTTGTTFTS